VRLDPPANFSAIPKTVFAAATILLGSVDGPQNSRKTAKETVVKRGFMVAVAGAAIVAAGLAGCSSNKSSAPSSPSSTAAASGSASVPGGGSHSVGAGQAKVTIDGQDQNASGQVVCTSAAGTLNIAIGQAGSGYTVVMTDSNTPDVHSVALGNAKGVALAYQQGMGQGNAEATKTGNAYKITGNVTGMDTTQGMQMVTKPFEIDVTCP
jgi:lipoprotein LpqH